MEESTEVRPSPAVKDCNLVLTLGGRVSRGVTLGALVAAAARVSTSVGIHWERSA
jgi:hypothetical protein